MTQDFYDDEETGPPTELDLAWYIRNVVSLGYPKGKRDPEPLPGGQLSIQQAIENGQVNKPRAHYRPLFVDAIKRPLTCWCGEPHEEWTHD